ncbi:uncharacterized protein LOC113563706 [Drosophila erecta]|nr:uncharacterized protein LOC113563706 [Drosophila erecta]
MSLQRSSSFSLTFNQNTAIVSRTNSRTIYEAYGEFLDIWDIGNEIFGEPPVRFPSSGGSNLPQSFGANGDAQLVTLGDQTSGGHNMVQLSNNLENSANNIYDANNNMGSCSKLFFSHKG